MENVYKPTARVAHLVVQHVSDEMLVYDMAAHRAFCLNRTAAHVWQECSGSATVDEIASKITAGRSAPDLVWLAIDQLSAFGLLDNEPPRRYDHKTRRAAIKALALASLIAVPVISTIATPKNNRGSMSVCVCTSSAQCLRPGCPSPPNCGSVGICI